MALVPSSSHSSGAAFNGGTITHPLVIDGDGLDTALVIHGDAGGNRSLIDAQTLNGLSALVVTTGGGVEIEPDTDSEDALQIFFKASHTGALLNIFQNFAPFATLLRVNKGGYLGLLTHSAPADGDVATGEATLWFDQTNGAGKLMVKAKTANGTVATAAIPLT